MANTSKRSPEKDEQIIEHLRLTGNVSTACRLVRINRRTYYQWRDQDAPFKDATDRAKREGMDALLDEIEIALIDRAKETDTTAAIFMLKSHRRAIYGDKAAVEHSGTITHTFRDLSQFTDAEIDALSAVAERVKAGQR